MCNNQHVQTNLIRTYSQAETSDEKAVAKKNMDEIARAEPTHDTISTTVETLCCIRQLSHSFLPGHLPTSHPETSPEKLSAY